jgi:D-galactarolactone cycloisomerase
MKLRAIETIGLEFELPPERAYGSAGGIHTRRQATLIRVTTEDGIEGYGEARGPYRLVKANVDLLTPHFLGTDILERETSYARFSNRLYHYGHQGPLIVAYSGINIAMLDALGKALNLPVCRLIGGMARPDVGAYATGGYLTLGTASRFEQQLEALRAANLSIAKIKIGLGPASDEERVSMTRRCLGDDVRIAVDANANYTVDVALESMNRIGPYGIAWFEEPLKPYDFEGYAHLRSRAPVAISAGEAHHTTHDFKKLLEGGCIDIAQPAVCACGGLDEARRIADLCRLHSTRIVASAWASGVGFAAAVQFAASIPQYPHSEYEPTPQLVEYDVGENPLREGILTEPFHLRDGKIVLPPGPGLGITVDQDTIQRHAIA